MEVGNGKQLGFPLGDPILSVFTLALRTMTVSSTVVAYPGSPAVSTGIHMAAQVSSTAPFDRRKRPQLPTVDLRVVFHLGPVLTEHMSYFKTGSQRLDKYSL